MAKASGNTPWELEGASEHHIQTRPSAWGWRLCIGVGVQMSVSEFVCAMYAYAGRASHAPGWKPILNALAAWAPNLTPLHFQIQRRPRSGDDLAKASGACIEAQYVATPLLQA